MSDPNVTNHSSLIDRERIRGASRMIAEGTEASNVTEEQIRQVADDVRAFVQAHKLPGKFKTVATAIGHSPGVISDFLNGKYKGNNGQIAIYLDGWLVEEEQRRSQPATTQFVWTNVAMEIKGVANYALDKRKISLIYGPDTSGIGKTTALQAIYQTLGPRRCTLVNINKVDANPTGLLKKICSAMAMDDSGSCRNRYTRIVEKLRGRAHLLIIDQIHGLRGAKEDKPLYILAEIFEDTRSAQLWSGTADMIAYLRRVQGKGDESMAQVISRVFPIVDLMEGVKPDGGGEPLATVDQVKEMFAKNRLKLTHAAARYLCAIVNTPDSGAFRTCVSLVEYATELAEMPQFKAASIDVPLVKTALRKGLMLERAEVFMRDVEQAMQRFAKVG